MNNDKTLILKMKKDDLFFGKINDYHIDSYCNRICNIKIINKVLRKLKLLDCSLCYGSWKRKIDRYETVIVFDSMYYTAISKYIKKRNQNVKINLYFWNSVNESNKFILSDQYIDDIYSFDTRDVEKYDLRYNPMFFTKNIEVQNFGIKREVLFFGRAKQRKELVLEIKDYLCQMGISNSIHIIENESDIIPYYECLTMIMESNCILDIVGSEQTGLTLRCTEALFLRKKIITNNTYIKQYDFYNENNILVISKDLKKEKIIPFLENDYEDIPDKIRMKYDFDSWFERFFE